MVLRIEKKSTTAAKISFTALPFLSSVDPKNTDLRDHVHFLGLVCVSLQRIVVIREEKDALVVHRLLAAE